MNVIFLDVDGVLNCERTFKELRRPKLDPECVALLKELVERTGAKIVVSSTWRLGDGWRNLADLLHERGIDRSVVIGGTPDYPVFKGKMIVADRRGTEIYNWLLEHADVGRFVILDDDDDMGPLRAALIQTTFERGLEREHVEEAVARLGEIRFCCGCGTLYPGDPHQDGCPVVESER